MMQKLLTLPQWALALLILCGGVGLLILADPPVSVCRSQMEALQSKLIPFVYPDPKRRIKTKTGFESSEEMCKLGNSPGACRELFDEVRKVLSEFETLNNECWTELTSVGPVVGVLRETVGLMAQIAWGDSAPKDRVDKLAWFDAYHLNTFCQIKKAWIRMSGENSWNTFAVAKVQQLPQANQLDPAEGWARSIFSLNCQQYR